MLTNNLISYISTDYTKKGFANKQCDISMAFRAQSIKLNYNVWDCVVLVINTSIRVNI